MKQINKISIWGQGSTKDAVIINAYAVNVTLGSSATFYYSLLSEQKEKLSEGNLRMSGDDYLKWSEDDNAWDWIASELNVTIIGDLVDPVSKEVQIDETISAESRTNDEIAIEEEI